MPAVVSAWKSDLGAINSKAAESLADPAEYPNLFTDLDLAVKAEQWSAVQRKRLAGLPASQYADYEGITLINLIDKMREMDHPEVR